MFKKIIKISSSHYKTNPNKKNVLIVSNPRSGSTWLMELIWSQAGFKTCNEPLNMRIETIQKAIGLRDFFDLYDEKHKDTIVKYFKEIYQGSHRFLNPSPFRKDWRFKTDRIVYKVINGGECQIDNIAEVTNSHVIFLMRHPFSVSLSRKQLPRLEVFMRYMDFLEFNASQVKCSRDIFKKGTLMEKAVLSWCIQNNLFLKNTKGAYDIILYENLVLNPIPILNELCDKCDLTEFHKMVARLRVPSAVTVQSSKGTKETIRNPKDQEKLLSRWKDEIDDSEALKLWRILEVFELSHFYDLKTGLPNSEYLNRESSKNVLF